MVIRILRYRAWVIKTSPDYMQKDTKGVVFG